jgi:2-isopropylmalate synthase
MHPAEHELIYDWNVAGETLPAPARTIEFDDETLRDGLQSPSVTSPSIDKKLEILHLIDKLGIQTADIGLPGAGPHVVEHVTRLAREIKDARLKVTANCAARTLESDIRPVAEISQKVGLPIEVCTFIGSSPIRQYAEDWDLTRMMKLSADAIDLGRKYNLPVAYVTEDTTRSRPEVLTKLFTNAVEHGRALCLCDTCTAAAGRRAWCTGRRSGARSIPRSDRLARPPDRGLGVINRSPRSPGPTACTARSASASVSAHADGPVVNSSDGWITNDLSALPEYRASSPSVRVPIPVSYPVVGRDVRTGTGVTPQCQA